MKDKLHGKEANYRRGHIPVDKWTDKEIFIDSFEVMVNHFKTDENVHEFFDSEFNERENDKLFRKVLKIEDSNGIKYLHTVYVKYTKEITH